MKSENAIRSPLLLFNFYFLTQYLLLSKETTCFCEAYRLKNLCD